MTAKNLYDGRSTLRLFKRGQLHSLILHLFLFCCCVINLEAQETVGISEKQFYPSELLTDIDSLYTWIHATHPDLHAMINSEEAEKKWKSVRQQIQNPMTRLEFARLISPVFSQYMDGHLALWAYFWEDEEFQHYIKHGGTFFPLPVKVKSKKIFLLENTVDLIAGTEITEINGMKTSDVIKELLEQIPGDTYENQEATISRLFNTTLWYVFGWGDNIQITYRSYNQDQANKVILNGFPFEKVVPYNFPKGNKNLNLLIFEEEGLAVIETFGFNSSKQTTRFLDSAFTVIKNKKIRLLAVDLRKNGGGSSSVGEAILQYITNKAYSQSIRSEMVKSEFLLSQPYNNWIQKKFETLESQKSLVNNRLITETGEYLHPPLEKKELFFDGDFYLLTSGQTFSSAHMLAAAVKNYKLGNIIGEETGSRMSFFGEPALFQLPNTGIWGQCPTVKHFMPGYTDNNKNKTITPNVVVVTTLKDIAENRDPIIEYLKQEAKKK